MHLLSCENPQRVYNKFMNEYIWVSCGKCNSCMNARAYRWTDMLERERLNSRYTLFITLTYDDLHLPALGLGYYPGFEISHRNFLDREIDLVPNNSCDNICIPYKQFLKDYPLQKEDLDLFFGLFRQFNGIPYASSDDIQKFNKRLNKYFHDNVTQKFKNFRYFVVSEYGSTTLRPHFHGIYFTDSREVAQCFRKAVSLSWNKGIIDCQFVENSACSYVSQYINKSADLPLFYQKGDLRPKYWFSKKPIIGALYKHDSIGVGDDNSEDLRQILDNGLVEHCVQRKASDTKFMAVPIDKSTENYLFPKCCCFGKISDSLRIELYTISCRFVRKVRDGFKGFLKDVCKYMYDLYEDYEYSIRSIESDLSRFLYEMFYKDWLSEVEDLHNHAYEWLRRLYYLSRKFMRNCLLYGKSAKEYLCLILNYYNNKELYILRKFYEFQQSYDGPSDDLALCYPEWLWTRQNMTIQDFCDNVNLPSDVVQQREIGYQFRQSNKKSHFKNAYLDSLELKRTFNSLFNTLKVYFYAKKCHETLEAVAAS